MTTHHPDLSTLMSYSAGSLPDAVATVVAAHLSVCSRCRQHVQEAEQVGIRLLEELEPATLSAHAKDDILALLDKTERAAADSREEQNIPNDSDVPPPQTRFGLLSGRPALEVYGTRTEAIYPASIRQ